MTRVSASILDATADEVLERCPICGSGTATIVCREGVLDTRREEPTTVVSNLCHGCGVIYTSPRLSRPTLARFYEEEQAQRRRVQPLAELLAGPESPKAAGRVAFVRPHLETDARVLEIGAGNCHTVVSFARSLPEGDVTGLDASFEGDTVATGAVRLVRGRLDEHAMPPGLAPAYNCIAAFHVLEHQHDPVAFLRRLAALLAPGAVLYLEVPNTYRHWWLGKDVEAFFSTVHLFNFGRRSLDALLRTAGFEPLAWQAPAKALRVIARTGGQSLPPRRPLDAAEVAAVQRYFAAWKLYSRLRRLPLVGPLASLAARACWPLAARRLARG